MSLFNGLRATRGQFYFLGPFLRAGFERAGRRLAPKAARAETPRRAEKAWRAENHGSRHREGPIGHRDQTNAAFAFLQGIAELGAIYTNFQRERSGALAVAPYRNPIYNARLSG